MSRRWSFVIAALCVAALLAVFVAPFASSAPDGLTKVAEDEGFIDRASGHDALAYGSVTGVLGLLVTFGVVVAVLRMLARTRSSG